MNEKSTFGASVEGLTPEMKDLINKRKERPEIGAIWDHQAKTTGNKFLSLKLKLTKEKLQQLLAASGEEVVEVSFVAFPNKFKEGNPKRPSFRIYDELNG